MHDLWHRSRDAIGTASRLRIPPAWVALTVVAAVSALGVTLVKVSARLLEEAAGQQTSAPATPVTARLRTTHHDGRPEVVVEGPPRASVLVAASARPIAVLSLDQFGRASFQVPAGTTGPLDIVILEGSATQLDLPPSDAHNLPQEAVVPTGAPAGQGPQAPSGEAPAVKPRIVVQPLSWLEWPISSTDQPPRSTPDTVSEPPPPSNMVRPAARNPSPSNLRDAPPVLHLITDAGPRLALTFDGNALSEGTDALFDTLSRLGLKVTLFVTGQFIDAHPGLVRRAVLAGHEIGTHCYSHPHLTSWAQNRRHDTLPTVTRAFLVDQLRRTELAFQRATGRPMAPLWRAPYGEENAQIREWALEEGYLHVRWSSLGGASLDSHDWVDDEHSKLYRDPDRMMRRLLRFPRLEGGIVLMHLASERPTPPWTALPELVHSLRDRGIEIVQVSTLLADSPTWRPWLARARAQSRSSSSGNAPRR